MDNQIEDKEDHLDGQLNRGQGTWTTAPQGFEAAATTLYSRWERIIFFLTKRDADCRLRKLHQVKNMILRQIWSVTDNAGFIGIDGTWTNGEENENDEAEAEKSHPRYAQNSYALVTHHYWVTLFNSCEKHISPTLFPNCTFSFVLVFAYSCLYVCFSLLLHSPAHFPARESC